MKIIHGMSEVAGQGINTVRGLRANGYDAVMAVWQRNKMAGAPDIDLGVNKANKKMMPFYALKMAVFTIGALRKYDVVHAHYGYSLFPLCLDTFFFKLFGVSCFAEFHGSDVRFVYNTEIKYPYFRDLDFTDKTRSIARRRRDRLLKHVKGIIVHDHELLPHLPKTDKPVYIVPLRVDLEGIEPEYPDPAKKRAPVIVHSPSKRSTKGTEQILEKLKEVKGEYELILVENMAHEEAMEIYRKADIIIDQVALGTYGVFSIEAMALGKPVITYLSPEMKGCFPEELPIISADFDNLPGVIDHLIDEPQLRHDIGVKGSKYAKRYHDNIKVAKYLYEIYDGTITEKDIFRLL